ncbi:MAG: PIN domain-containing protein [Bacteroidota bacterium]
MHLIDADIMIDLSCNHPNAIDFFQSKVYAEEVRLSPLTEMELVQGVRNKKELKEMRVFLAQFDRATITDKQILKAMEIQQEFFLSHGIGILDSLLAGMAIVNSWTLVSRNSKHFDFIDELDLLVPY